MRRILASTLLCAALAAAVAAPSPAKGRHSEKIDGLVAAAADARGTTPNTQLDVIVVGSNPDGALRRHGREKRDLSAVGAAGATVSAGELDALAADPGVAAIVPDAPVAPAALTDWASGTSKGSAGVSFPDLATLYPFVDNAQAAWGAGLTGQGVGIAVVDSGVATAPDFGGRLVNVDVGNGVADEIGHGTMVAGIAAGSSSDGHYVGIAPGATVYAIDVSPAGGPRTSDVIAGLLWVAQNQKHYNIRVVNLSLQETTPSSYRTSLLDSVVELLWAHGVVVVTSAGNGGPGAVDFAPANDPFAIAVGASDTADTAATGDDSLAWFSAYGTTVDGIAKPDIVAPGRHIVSLLPAGTSLALEAPTVNWAAPSYASIGGTSFSAPQIAGAAALLLEANPDWTPDQVKWVLAHTERPLAGSAAGALDVAAAAAYSALPGKANQGLVSACTDACAGDNTKKVSLTGLTWDGATWNGATWNGATWNGATWNGATWNGATWNGATWNGATWNGATWNGATWNAATWG